MQEFRNNSSNDKMSSAIISQTYTKNNKNSSGCTYISHSYERMEMKILQWKSNRPTDASECEKNKMKRETY